MPNGIAVGKDKASLGIGPGQANRIWATNSAIERSGEDVKGAVLASDAFFAFRRLRRSCGTGGHHGDHPARRLPLRTRIRSRSAMNTGSLWYSPECAILSTEQEAGIRC